MPAESAGKEAVVLVPGFNASLNDSLRRMGQFVSLARLPPHLIPFVFSWPGGGSFSYYQVVPNID